MKNRITDLLGVRYPMVQARMGWIARAQLASAVSNAGGLGIIETSSGRLDEVREEVKKMKALTDKPWGINVAQAFVRDPDIVSFVADQGVLFVTTSAGDPHRYTDELAIFTSGSADPWYMSSLPPLLKKGVRFGSPLYSKPRSALTARSTSSGVRIV